MSHSIDDYDIGQEIGRGGFGVVYRAKHRASHEDVAVKIIDKQAMTETNRMDKVKNEISVHRQLRHPNIVQFLGCYESQESLYIVLELCRQGNLYAYLKRRGKLPECEAVQIIRQILCALEYMHGQGIIHRDLKLANILLNGDSSQSVQDGLSITWRPGQLKLCDFGLAVQKEHPDEDNMTICGTANYMSPEVAKSQSHSFPADVWSVGCLFYTLVVGRAPFHTGSVQETMRLASEGSYEIPLGLFSEQGEQLLKDLLKTDQKQRLNVRQILAHPLLTSPRNSPTHLAMTRDLMFPLMEGSEENNEQNVADEEKRKRNKMEKEGKNQCILSTEEIQLSEELCGRVSTSASSGGWHIERNGRSPASQFLIGNAAAPANTHTLSSVKRIHPTNTNNYSQSNTNNENANSKDFKHLMAKSRELQGQLSLPVVNLHQQHFQFDQVASAAGIGSSAGPGILMGANQGVNSSSVTQSTALITYPSAQMSSRPSSKKYHTGSPHSGHFSATTAALRSGEGCTLSRISESHPLHFHTELVENNYGSPELQHHQPQQRHQPQHQHQHIHHYEQQQQEQQRQQQQRIQKQKQEQNQLAQQRQIVQLHKPIVSSSEPTLAPRRGTPSSPTAQTKHQLARGRDIEVSRHSNSMSMSERGHILFGSKDDARLQLMGEKDGGQLERRRNSMQYQHRNFHSGDEQSRHRSGSLNESFLYGSWGGGNSSIGESISVSSPVNAHNNHHVRSKTIHTSSQQLISTRAPDSNKTIPTAVEHFRELKKAMTDMPSLCARTAGGDLLMLCATSDEMEAHKELVMVTHVSSRQGVSKLIRLVLRTADASGVVLGQVHEPAKVEYESLLSEVRAHTISEGKDRVVQDLQLSPLLLHFSSLPVSEYENFNGDSHTASITFNTSRMIDGVMRHSKLSRNFEALFSVEKEHARKIDVYCDELDKQQPLLAGLLHRAAHLINEVRARLPKVTFYCTPAPQVDASFTSMNRPHEPGENNYISLHTFKCVLMSNAPFADFYVQWRDGASLRYEPLNERVHIDLGPTTVPAMKWSGELGKQYRNCTSLSNSSDQMSMFRLIPTHFIARAKVALRAHTKCCSQIQRNHGNDRADGGVVLIHI